MQIIDAKEVIDMNGMLSRTWRTLALRGTIAILFGALALAWPNLTLLTLTFLFAAFALLTGAVETAGALKMRKSNDDWWLTLLIGLVSLGAGVIAVVHPALTALVLVLVIGANALVTGVLDIATAIRLRKANNTQWLLVLNGIASVVFGVLVFLFPTAGALALVWLISFYSIVAGALLLALAFQVRGMPTKAGETDRRMGRDRRTMPAHP